MNCYYYVADGTNPYENLALEELLYQSTRPDDVILYLWQNDNTVVIGRNQNAWRECRLESFTAQSGRLARRLSGGGAVYHDMGNQNFTFLAGAGLYDVGRQTEVIRLAAKHFGIDAQRSGRNDILAGDRKFSGNAFHRGKTASFHHGTILISSDMTRLSQFLAPSPEKLAAKGVESVRARVMNLCEQNPAITPRGMRQALLGAFEAVYRTPPLQLPDERIDNGLWRDLTTHYSSDQWRLGRLSEFTVALRNRFSFGEVEFQLQVEEGVVQSAKVYSDAMDADWIASMEATFTGLPFRADSLAGAVPESLFDPANGQEVAEYLRHAFE